ncbi:acetyl-CoA synthetase-like protein [Gloeophyllum trabeum ATCC 11539]|uniref:Acetyl-CoA synthetase-like protein n=1 Tax=Gloeophyllum trabeum (strain ATCC 11539 / FP-39264 / Madison 617) TaxID=670483 RepID=S7RXV8_GLOTA|nr:acetyl-CoA synthetase-like protein [Gloeophyllum trabeum ATCC 11539]EPQ59775.1 acetyl-CoA synthetase-like protein [Gloeophyllum trabeum ATCC 11539]
MQAHAVSSLPATLPELLHTKSGELDSVLVFLRSGTPKVWSYAQLFEEASIHARRLTSLGLRQGGGDVILTSFLRHEDHILFFWACCLAGIPVCPLPAWHPDPSRQAAVFRHLCDVFENPTLVTTSDAAQTVHALAPDLRVITAEELPSPDTESVTYPTWKPCPDDVVCYMLTSGSTGKSKAVALRHSNLLSAVRGKIAHHGTSSTSRFLNWISFDHVACLCEVHLHALEVNGSQFHTSPSEIIRRPSDLLRLCSEFKITYTFSPNFLLAKICEENQSAPYDKLDLSPLHSLISGGEAVPIKTAVAFADLMEKCGAPRNALRAGFGMTETCAGSVYDTRPILRDPTSVSIKYLSVGKSCNGISVRIVEPITGSASPPDKIGSLQVRGPTVFRQYHNDPMATAEAFTADGWFVTGELGYLDQDGNLHLVGRTKDVLNINGLKYASEDVEHYVEEAGIPGVVKSSVFVCPVRIGQADTETYAVFYQHDMGAGSAYDEAYGDEIVASNKAVKSRCAMFCSQAPHVVLALPRQYFVKSALGKVSRSGLSHSYLAGEFKDAEGRQTSANPTQGIEYAPSDMNSPVEHLVAKAISDVFDCSITGVRREQNIFDFGASSLHLMRLKHVLEERLSVRDIPTIELLRRPNVGELCDYIGTFSAEGSSSALASVEYQPLVCLNASGLNPPLFLVHPGVGEILVFIGLARMFTGDRPVYALRARGFDHGESPFGTFQEMVDSYTSAIEKCLPNGPYCIAGYSFGGAVAFEIGKRWQKAESASPGSELIWTEVLLNLTMFLSLIPSLELDSVRAALLAEFPAIEGHDMEPCEKTRGAVIKWIFKRANQRRLSELNLELNAFARWVKVAYEINRTGRTFEPRGCVKGALTTVFCAVPLPSMGTREEYRRERLSAWKEFSGPRFEMVDVDGEHYTMLSEEHIDSFAQKLKQALQRSEKSPVEISAQMSPSKADFDAVPVIDFGLAEKSPNEYFQQLKYALEEVGFLVLVNVPGFEASFQQDLFALAESLFRKPQAWKDSLGTENSFSLRGYFRADTIEGAHKAHAEAYRFGAEMPAPGDVKDTTVPFWLRLHEGPNQWPPEEDVPGFRRQMEVLFERYYQLNLTLNQHICALLGVDAAVLDAYFPAKREFNSAIWHYFPVTPEIARSARDGFAQAMHEHRDPSTFVTCLIQSRAGLQVQNHAGAWVDIPMVEGGVVCNIGMHLMTLTGGRLVATTHRVNTLKIDEDRYTIPYVLSTRLDKRIEPLPQFAAKAHVPPNPKILKLMAVEDPLVRSGYARLSLFPAATKRLYPKEFEEARALGVL